MSAILVTGAAGFLGRHLLDRLPTAADLAIVGRKTPSRIRPARFVKVDLRQADDLKRAIQSVQPRLVFHLAGRTPPADDPEFDASNRQATVHLLDALRSLNQTVRVVLVGSAAELGPVPDSMLPVGEDYPCDPQGAYAASKLQATRLGLSTSPPLEVMVARVFNPIGPGMPDSQAFGRFASVLARSTDGPKTMTVGDLTARRDFIDARDVADALIALAERGRAGRLYHVGTGQSRSIGEGLDRLIQRCNRNVPIVPDRDRPRTGPADSRADIRRIVSEVGWTPRIGFEQSLDDLWDAEVRRVAVGFGVD